MHFKRAIFIVYKLCLFLKKKSLKKNRTVPRLRHFVLNEERDAKGRIFGGGTPKSRQGGPLEASLAAGDATGTQTPAPVRAPEPAQAASHQTTAEGHRSTLGRGSQAFRSLERDVPQINHLSICRVCASLLVCVEFRPG